MNECIKRKVVSTAAQKYAIRSRRPLPRWKQAEEYFRKERDRKLVITLPRVTMLEDSR